MKAELIEFFSVLTVILYIIKEQKPIATTPDLARSGEGGGQGFVFEQGILISI